MREVSQKFNDLYNKRGRFEYALVFGGKVVFSSDFADSPNWIDGFSDGEEFCIGNAFMGSFNCVLKESATVPNVGEIIGVYMRIVVDYDIDKTPELIDVTFTARAVSEEMSPAIEPMSVDFTSFSATTTNVNDEFENVSEWVLIGTYRVMEVTHDHKTRRISIKCFDFMWYLENTSFIRGETVTFPMTYANAVERIKRITGVPIDDMLNTTHIIDNVPDDMSCRLVLSFMLITIGANARCKPDGMITGWGIMHDIAPPNRQFTPDEPILISEWDYDVIETEHPPITGLRISNRGGNVFFSGNATGYILDVHVPWLRGQAAVDETLSYIRGYVNMPILIGNSLVNPAIQPWDKVIGRVSGEVYRVTYLDVHAGAMPRTDCQNGVWEQFEHPGAESERMVGGGFGGGVIQLPHLPTPQLISTWHDGDTVVVYDTRYPWDGHGAPPPVDCPGGGGGGITNPADLISLEDGNAIVISTQDGRLFVSETFGIREWADILNKPSTIMNIDSILADLQRQIDNIGYISPTLIDVTFIAEVILEDDVISHIEIIFDRVVHGFNLSHVDIIPLTGNATKQALSGIGTTYRLDINVVSVGTIRLVLSNFSEFRVTTPHVVLNLKVPVLVLVVPQMTSNTLPVPFVASASSAETSGTYRYFPFKAFDRWLGRTSPLNLNDGWSSTLNFSPSTGIGNAWLQIDTGAITDVNLYKVHNRQEIPIPASTYSAADFTFSGSNDGVNWTVLDTVIDRELSHTPLATEHKLSSTTSYRYYRITITRVHLPNSGYVMIGQLELFRYE